MSRVLSVLLASGVLGLSACGSSDGPTDGNGDGNGNGDPGPPASISPVSGDGQRVATGATALDPWVVRVADASARGVPNVRVDWQVTSGSGTLSSSTTFTSADGTTQVNLTAGSSAGEIEVVAVVEELSDFQTDFTSTAVTPVALASVGGDGQSARILQPLAAPFEVEVTAGDGGAAPGAAVSWSVTGGDGSLSAASSIAAVDGIAEVTLTLGSVAGQNGAEATLTGVSDTVSFNATGSNAVSVTISMTNIAFVVPPASRPPGGGSDDARILLGDTIVWVNLDATAHTATSDSIPSGGTAFDSGSMNTGDSFTFVPDVRGDWIYSCRFHPVQMADARIEVR